MRGWGGATQPSSLPPRTPGLGIGLPLPRRRSWWGPQELPWTLGVRPGSSWAPPVTLHPEGRPFEPLWFGHGVARGGRGVPLSLVFSLPPPSPHPRTPHRPDILPAAKATRNLGVVIQQAQTCFVPRGALPARWLPPPPRFHSFLYSQCGLARDPSRDPADLRIPSGV